MTQPDLFPWPTDEVFKAPYIEGGVFAMEIHPPEVMSGHHVHGHIELNYMLDCQATYLVNGQEIQVPDERVILFWANMPHQMIAANAEGRMLNIYIPLPMFLDWKLHNQLQDLLLGGSMVIAPNSLSPSPRKLASWLSDYKSEDPRFRELMTQDLALLFKRLCLIGWESTDIALNPTHTRDDRMTSSSTRSYKHVADIVHFISKNLHRPLSTIDVAEHLGLHRNYTINLFKKAMGVSIKQYIQYQRLQVVQSMLIDTDMSVSDIAYATGFNSLGRFYDAFSRHYGMAPKQFRKKLKADFS